MLKLLVFLTLCISSLYAKNLYVDYLVDYSKKNELNTSKQYNSYKKAYEDALNDYKNNIKKLWPIVDVSNNSKWVEYSNNYKYKKIIDYKKKIIYVEVIVNNDKYASTAIIILYENLLKYDTNMAFKNDILRKKTYSNLNKAQDIPIENIKLISDVLNEQEQENILKEVSLQEYKTTKYKNNTIYKSQIKLPTDFTIRKAKSYKNIIQNYAKNSYIDKNILFSIIQAESSFNPLAQSHIPAFGLMQIVPKTAGIDAYYKLYGKKKLLSSRYLFKADNNVKIGSTYLNLIFYKYLKNIKNKKSRLYCTIAAYNTGVSNFAKTFGKQTSRTQAIEHVNKMSSSQVYKKLLKRLPAKQTRLYLSKVNRYIKQYNKLNL